MRGIRPAVLLTATMVTISACAPRGPTGDVVRPGEPGSRQERTLTISIEHEPNFVAALAPIASLAATDLYQRPFNAFLDRVDDQGRPLPYLAEALPTLNTDTWIVFPDGRMETRYRLKPNLVWHDGAPLTAEDFAFAFRVATPGAGFRTGTAPFTVIDEVIAPDDRTLIIRWKGLYPDAGLLQGGSTRFGLAPLPRHLLEQPFAEQSREAMQDHPYWSREFVGAGPYKLDRWEIGSYLEAVAFDQHVLGRPRIERVRFMFIPDQNTALSNMLAGTVHVALNSIAFSHLLELKREWAGTNRGTTDYTAVSLTAVQAQLRPEYSNPRVIRDLRVRKALAHGIDKQTFGETIWGGELPVVDSIFEPTSAYYPVIDRAIAKYPYDPRASERLMNEVGYAKGPDGFFTSPIEGKLAFTLSAPQARQERPVLAANWRQIGFDVQEQALPPALATDPEVRSTFSAMTVTTSGATDVQQLALYRSSEVTSAENRWRGENRGGWINAEFDRLVQTYFTTMEPNERIQQRAQLARILTEELPSIPLSYNPNAHAYLASVTGLTSTSLYTTGRPTWNIHEWEIR